MMNDKLTIVSTEMGLPQRTSTFRGGSARASRSARVRCGSCVKEEHRESLRRATGHFAQVHLW
jgi:hypothetical protein